MNDSDSEMSACPRDSKSKIAERGMSEHREKIRILEDNKFKHYSLFFSNKTAKLKFRRFYYYQLQIHITQVLL